MAETERVEIPMTDITNVIDGVMERSAWGEKLETSMQELDTIKTEVNNKVTEMDGKVEEINNMQTEINTKVEEMNQIQTEVNAKVEEMNQTQTQVNNKVQEMDGIKTEIENKVVEINGLQTDINNKVQEFEGIKNEVSGKVEEIDTIKGEIDGKVQKLDNIHGFFGYKASGHSLSLSPTSDFPVSKLKLYGKSEQEKTTGAQLLPYVVDRIDSTFEINYTIKNGFITLKGTNTTSDYITISLLNNSIINLQNGTYTMSIQDHSGTENFVVQFYNARGDNGFDYATVTNKIKMFEFTNSSGNYNAVIAIEPGKTVDCSFGVMLNAGSTALPYESYTGGAPSPSPDYPQEIDVPGLVCRGNNLFNYKNATWIDNEGAKNIKAENSGVSFTTSTKHRSCGVYFNGYNLNTSMSASFDVKFSSLNFTGFRTSGGFEKGSSNFALGKFNHIEFPITQNTSSLTFYVDNSSDSDDAEITVEIRNIMINAGSTPLPYEPFSSGINQLNITAESQTIQGVTFTVNEDKSITANGTNTGNRSAVLTLMSMPINIIEQSTVVIQAQSGLQIYFSVDGKDVYSIEGGGIYTIEAGHILNLAYAYVKNNTTVSNITARIMLVKSEYANYPYSPYVENGGNIRKFNVIGVEAGDINQFDITVSSATISGVTFTVNKDKSITANGTNTGAGSADFHLIKAGGMYVSEPTSIVYNAKPNVKCYFILDGVGKYDINSGGVYTIEAGHSLDVLEIYVDANASVSNATVNIMLVKPEYVEYPYAPYRTPSTAILRTPSGLPGIKVPDDYADYTYIDEDGHKWVADTIEYDGDVPEYVKRVGYINGGSASWSLYGTNTQGKSRFLLVGYKGETGGATTIAKPILCNKYASIPAGKNGTFGCFEGISINASGEIFVYDEAASGYTVEQFKEYQKDLEIYYILAEPVTTDMDDTKESIRQFHTLEDKTLMTNTGDCIMDTEYTVDTRTEVEKRPQYVKGSDRVIHAFHINGHESNPKSMVTYLGGTIYATPAGMNYSSGQFNYGSWGSAFFMPRPVMLRTDCTVAYELNVNDYTKKKDGTASDVANPDFDGNAMMEWGNNGRIWWKMEPDKNDPFSGSFYVANYQPDLSYHDWNYHERGNRFYTPIYPGSLINGRMRSLSGQTVAKSLTAAQQRTYAKANGEYYDILQWADWILVSCLSILISKTCDSQTAFGKGQCSDEKSESKMLTTGTMNGRGLMWGENTGIGQGIKLFGMENWYGSQWKRCIGLINDHGTLKVKLTKDTRDGSSVGDYNLTGTGYTEIHNSTPTGTNSGYASQMLFNQYGMTPKTVSGSSSTYYTDGGWFNNNQSCVALLGGSISNNFHCGILCAALDTPLSSIYWDFGTSLSCKPPAM